MNCRYLSQEYFFDPEVLTEGEVAPNDRCCRICGKIGHFMKDCPLRKRLVKNSLLTASHYSVSCNVHICNGCLFYWCRSKHRKDSERRPEHLRDKMDPGEDPRDQVRQRGEHWRKRDALETRCCYLCGSSAHIKKDCQLYRSPAGSVFSIKNHQKSYT